VWWKERLVSTNDIFLALIKEFHALKPTYKHYYGNVPEEYQRPCILYELLYNTVTRTSFFNLNKRVSIQAIIFVPVPSTGVSSLRDELSVFADLEPFLAGGELVVGTRHLMFNYSVDNVDDEIGIKLEFEYLDNASTPEFDEQQAWELMWHINLKQEVNANG
jgi:hypothetical protein